MTLPVKTMFELNTYLPKKATFICLRARTSLMTVNLSVYAWISIFWSSLAISSKALFWQVSEKDNGQTRRIIKHEKNDLHPSHVKCVKAWSPSPSTNSELSFTYCSSCSNTSLIFFFARTKCFRGDKSPLAESVRLSEGIEAMMSNLVETNGQNVELKKLVVTPDLIRGVSLIIWPCYATGRTGTESLLSEVNNFNFGVTLSKTL